jgi:hypothetical protein
MFDPFGVGLGPTQTAGRDYQISQARRLQHCIYRVGSQNPGDISMPLTLTGTLTLKAGGIADVDKTIAVSFAVPSVDESVSIPIGLPLGIKEVETLELTLDVTAVEA